ncbi:hypothetical protein [Streptomyces sp. NPDC002209]|uniref:hypothetical protein n=1 Tax=Streptomyces sp. NPDC002209 TaxID=3364638 RepID=UPI003691A1DC
MGEGTIGTATVVGRLGQDAGGKSSLSQRDPGAEVAEEGFTLKSVGRGVRGARVGAVGAVGVFHSGGERRIAFASLINHGGGNPDLRCGDDGQSGFQVVEDEAPAFGGESRRSGGRGLRDSEFRDCVAGPRLRTCAVSRSRPT